MIIPSPYKNYPNSYSTFVDLIKAGYKPNQMGFQVDTSAVYRFTNRFRVARAFQGIKLDNYSNNTVMGYDSLFKVFLAYSAFELFLKMMGQKQSTILPIIAPYNPTSTISFIVKQDQGWLFYTFLHQHINTALLRKNLTDVYKGNSQNITYLASAVRHIFAHGHLSAHANGCEPTTVQAICESIFDFHMTVMEDRFSGTVAMFKSKV